MAELKQQKFKSLICLAEESNLCANDLPASNEANEICYFVVLALFDLSIIYQLVSQSLRLLNRGQVMCVTNHPSDANKNK